MAWKLLAWGFSAALAGCASPQVVWRKEGGTQAGYEQDRYACLIDSKDGVGGFDDRVFNACMGARGYVAGR